MYCTKPLFAWVLANSSLNSWQFEYHLCFTVYKCITLTSYHSIQQCQDYCIHRWQKQTSVIKWNQTEIKHQWVKDGSYWFGQLASLFRWVDNFIVEDREVKSQAETDGMCGLHFFGADIQCLLVGLLWVIDDGFTKKNRQYIFKWKIRFLEAKSHHFIMQRLCVIIIKWWHWRSELSKPSFT